MIYTINKFQKVVLSARDSIGNASSSGNSDAPQDPDGVAGIVALMFRLSLFFGRRREPNYQKLSTFEPQGY
jgi:hypothetical protein